MKDYSVSSAAGKQERNPSFKAFLVQWPEWARAMVGGAVLGLVALLHLSLIVYLTIPPVPIDREREPITESSVSVLKARFVEATFGVDMPPAPILLPSTGHALATPAGKKRHAAVIFQASLPIESGVAPVDGQSEDTRVHPEESISPTIPYGSPVLQRMPTETSSKDPRRLPGNPDGALVSSVALSEPSSIRQAIRNGGQYMNCSQVRMARFLSASEMDKRHITKQQLDQAFTEYGCR